MSIGGNQMTRNQNNVLQKRLLLLKSLELYINESIYYRSYGEQMDPTRKYVVWNYSEKIGKVSIK